jgi:LysM repeat protein
MSESNINSELLSADARGRKSIPLAVFAVIFVHIVLFVVLLIAAGCRAKARARRSTIRPQEVVKVETNSAPAQTTLLATNTASPLTQRAEPVLVTEPVIEDAPENVQKPVAQKAISRPTASISRMQIHVVQPGESIAKIAKQYGVSVQAIRSENELKSNIIRVGQKLRVNLEKARRPKDTFAAL